jgi:hypothetical protein
MTSLSINKAMGGKMFLSYKHWLIQKVCIVCTRVMTTVMRGVEIGPKEEIIPLVSANHISASVNIPVTAGTERGIGEVGT